MRKAAAIAGSCFALTMATPMALAQEVASPPDTPAENWDGAEVTLGSEESSVETPSGNTITKATASDGDSGVVEVEVEKADTPSAVESPDRPEPASKAELPEQPEPSQRPETPQPSPGVNR